ncbi:MAG: hypothetical protein K2G60_07135 [Oscillospiraceae bacterium]|nr:hypothetical protein [Oscillospiraceae bacterium]
MFGRRKSNGETDKRKKLKNLAMLDLTDYTPQSLRNIKSISNVAMLLVADGDADYIEALSEIELENIACKISVPHGTKLCTVNGSAFLTNETVKKDSIYLINGLALVYDLSEEKNVGLITNGTALIKKGSNPNIIHANGEVYVDDFDVDKLKLIENKMYIDANFVKECETGTIAVADNKIYIDDTVTADMLREKEFKFISGNKIICRKELWGYVQSHAHIGNKIAEYEEENIKKK